MLICRLLISFKINFFKKFFQDYHQGVNRQGKHVVRTDLGPNCLQTLSADDTSRQSVNSSRLGSDLSFHNYKVWVWWVNERWLHLLQIYSLHLPSPDNLCKHFGPRSGLAECGSFSGSKQFDTPVFMQDLFENINFWNSWQTKRKA